VQEVVRGEEKKEDKGRKMRETAGHNCSRGSWIILRLSVLAVRLSQATCRRSF
jgi:hypothetical protein